ncbi:MAG: hypothetical protein ACRDMV_10005 [Streptosporangiales bacterium]
MPAGSRDDNGRWTETIDELAAETGRVARRLRGLSEPRLRRRLAPYGTVADAGHRLAQALADAAQGVEERGYASITRRPVPRLAVRALGDQVDVTAGDLLAALATLGPQDEVWAGGDRTSAHRLAADTVRLAHEIKLAID